MEFKSFLVDSSEGKMERCKHTLRLDTYGCGCAHDCAYCYAKAILAFRGNWDPSDPRVADPDRIREEVAKMEPGTVIRMGGMTDCFQPCERIHGVTRMAIEALNDRGIHQIIVTKSDLVAEYMDVLDRDLSHVQVSITSTSDGMNAFKEKAPAPSRRMEAVRRLSEAGFDVCVRLSPYMPEYVDLGLLRERTGCGKVLVEFLRVNGSIRKILDIDYKPFKLKLGGYRHLTLKDKKRMLEPILETFDEVSVCEDVAAHQAYFANAVNHNPADCCNLRGV